MGWVPGQTLGKNETGLRKPLIGRLVDRQNREGLGYRDPALKNYQVLEQIVETLKLKVEQNPIQRELSPVIESVFEEEKKVEQVKDYKSEISIEVLGYEIDGLIDTGSDLTCISESFWQELSRTKGDKISLMPIKPFHIRTAVGHKSAEIKKVILLPLNLGPITIETRLLVVPELVNHIILGFDWLKENEASISIQRKLGGLVMAHNGDNYLVKFKESSEKVKDSTEMEHLNIIESTVGNTTYEFKSKGLNLRESQSLEKLLTKYDKLFTSGLGRANCYQHEIKMDPHAPIVK